MASHVTSESPVTGDQEHVYRRLMTSTELVTAPEVSVRLLGMLDGNGSARAVAALIARDPSLTASLLRLANSAFYGARARLTNVQQVVTMLGFTRVRQLALNISLWGHVGGLTTEARALRVCLWKHSVATATAARALAVYVRTLDAEHAYAVGLLHDVGQLVMGFHFGAPYWQLLGGADEPDLPRIEEREFGCNHATVAGWLLQLWRLSPALVQPVAGHHRPPSFHRDVDMAGLVGLADRLAAAIEKQDDLPADIRAGFESLSGWRLSNDQWSDLVGDVQQERRAMDALFGA
jgi:HD-like signal output (HDOD) protein